MAGSISYSPNAGLGRAVPLEAVTEAQIDEQFAVNFKGLFLTVQKAVPLMDVVSTMLAPLCARSRGRSAPS